MTSTLELLRIDIRRRKVVSDDSSYWRVDVWTGLVMPKPPDRTAREEISLGRSLLAGELKRAGRSSSCMQSSNLQNKSG